MEWTNEIILEFLDLYEQEPTIWNPLNHEHKDRNNVYDAWKRIQMNFSLECSMKDLKRKKDNLMATYRKLSLKAKKSGRSATKQVFKPEWFAYEKMASFLHTVYAPRSTKTTAVEIPKNRRAIDDDDIALNNGDETPNIVTDQANSSTASNTIESEDQGSPTVTKGGPPLSKKRKSEQVAHIGKRMDDAYHFLKQVATKPKPTKDESALFCDLLCVRLQALDEETRAIAVHEINNLMFSYREFSVQTNYMANNTYATMNQYQYPHYRTGNNSQNVSPDPTPSPSCASGTSSP